MHVLIDLFGCNPDKAAMFEAPDAFRVEVRGDRAWLDGLSFEDLDAGALAREIREALDADFAEYMVIERGDRIREPRRALPWFTAGRPAPES